MPPRLSGALAVGERERERVAGRVDQGCAGRESRPIRCAGGIKSPNYIEFVYNQSQKHRALNFFAPAEYEARDRSQSKEAACGSNLLLILMSTIASCNCM